MWPCAGSRALRIAVAAVLMTGAVPGVSARRQAAPVPLTPRVEAARVAYQARRFEEAERELLAAVELVRADRARQVAALTMSPPPARLRVGIDLPQPEKTREVLPRYPAAALERGAVGFVVVEAVIDKEGRTSRSGLRRKSLTT